MKDSNNTDHQSRKIELNWYFLIAKKLKKHLNQKCLINFLWWEKKGTLKIKFDILKIKGKKNQWNRALISPHPLHFIPNIWKMSEALRILKGSNCISLTYITFSTLFLFLLTASRGQTGATQGKIIGIPSIFWDCKLVSVVFSQESGIEPVQVWILFSCNNGCYDDSSKCQVMNLLTRQ